MSSSQARLKARRERATLKRAGVAVMHRVSIENAALAKVAAAGADPLDFVAMHIGNALEVLAEQGGDVLAHTVVTIGRHPDYPDAVTIEAKAAERTTPEA